MSDPNSGNVFSVCPVKSKFMGSYKILPTLPRFVLRLACHKELPFDF